MLGEKEKLTLEEYVAFVDNRNRRRLSVDQLNQVVSMHGFCRFRTKKAIIAALKPLELMSASRSTLDKNNLITSVDADADADAGLELEEIHWDIAAIGWQECPLGSVMTIQSGGPTEKPIKPMKRPMSIANWGTKKRRNGLPDPGPGPLVVLADLVDSTTT